MSVIDELSHLLLNSLTLPYISLMSTKSASLKARNWKRKQNSLNFIQISIVVFLACVSFIYCAFFYSFIIDVEKPSKSHSISIQKDAASISSKLSYHKDKTPTSLILPNEDAFTQTLKQCTERSCKRFNPDETRPNLKRVAYIHTGTKASLELFNVMKEAFRLVDIEKNIDLIKTSHVPALGYGKSHGWTQIIRVMHSPLLLETLETMEFHKGQKIQLQEATDLSIATQGMRQIVRHHCRLSQVAAHTALYNIDLTSDDISKRVMQMMEEILGKDLKSSGLNSFLEKAMPNISKMNSKHSVDTEYMNAFTNILQDELDSTNGLKKWPCRSFWDINEITQDATKLAQEFVPECNAEFVKCTVQFDVCEMNGGAKKCKKK